MEAVYPIFADYGLPGAVIIALGFYAWNRTQKVDELHEKRAEDGRQTQRSLDDNTRALETLSEIIKSRGAP